MRYLAQGFIFEVCRLHGPFGGRRLQGCRVRHGAHALIFAVAPLEWQSRRPKNWQGAKNAWKQWLAYTELDSNYHQDRLDKEDIKDTCYSYMIDKTLYDMILAAPEAEQPRKIEKLEDMEEDDEDENEEHGD